MLYGKGQFMWQLWNCDGGVPAAIQARATAAGISHVLIKLADGANWPYNVNLQTKVDYVPPVLSALREVGIQVWGWQYVRGDDPVGEARLAIQRVLALGVDGFVVDAEGEYKAPGKKAAAHRYMTDLRTALPNLPIALSTYRFPQTHPEFPFSEFLQRCDIAMPQVYFEQAHNVEEQLDRSVQQYQALAPSRPIIPTGPTYSHSGWKPTPDEVTRFLVHAKGMGFTASNFWAWDFSTRPGFTPLWDAVAQFDWPATAPAADMPERLIGRWNSHDAGLVAGLYATNAAHVTGMSTVVGTQAISDWYQTLFSQLLPNGQFAITGKSGTGASRQFTWKASGDTGSVVDGNDTLGLLDGKIQFHYTYFTIVPN